jgi:hypothetical protein
MRKIALLSISALALVFASCKKGPGEGGRSKIKGKVWIENYNTLNHMYDTYSLKDEYAGADKDVYLIFGDDIGYGKNTKTGPNGEFEFDYMREGDYTVYVQSKDTTRTSVSGITTMKVAVSLGKKETGDVGTIVIYN